MTEQASQQKPWTLAGRRALVTGAAHRIGRQIALALAEAGADLVLHHRTSREDTEETANMVRGLGAEAHLVSADLARPGEADRLLDRAVAGAGPLDLLVNNASIFPSDSFDDFDPGDQQRTLQVNSLGPLALTRAFARQGRRGAVVNLLDTRIAGHDPGHLSYSLSKKLLHEITRGLALTLSPRITVNAVAPGLVLPPPGEDEAFLQRLAPTVPLERHGDAEDVARAVRFLLESRFITGQVIFVDGGSHLLGGGGGRAPG